MKNASFAENFVRILEEKNISRYRLSKDIGIPAPSLQRYVNGEGEPTLGNLIKISEYLSVSMDELVYGEKQDFIYENSDELKIAEELSEAFTKHEVSADPLKFYKIVKALLVEMQQDSALDTKKAVENTVRIMKIAS